MAKKAYSATVKAPATRDNSDELTAENGCALLVALHFWH